MQEISRELLVIMAKRGSIETGIFPRLTDEGIIYRVQIGIVSYKNGKRKQKNMYATCNSLEEARAKRDEFQQLQVRKGAKGKMAQLKERIAQLEEEVEDLRATLEIKGDKELYDVIKSTDENTELYDEKDLKW